MKLKKIIVSVLSLIIAVFPSTSFYVNAETEYFDYEINGAKIT